MIDIRVHTPDAASIDEAADRLRSGDVVVVPTETVYGLAASTSDASAISRIFTLKSRPADNPLIAHVLDEAQACSVVSGWDDRCRALAEHFWPGPLTMILPRRPVVPAIAAGGRDTLAVRSPAHPVARAVLTALGTPFSAPSANRSNMISPTRASHVVDDYRTVQEADGLLVLDGGECEFGIESTVLDLTTSDPTILRPGSIPSTEIESLLGSVACVQPNTQIHAPGTASRHYAPRTPMHLLHRDEILGIIQSQDEHLGVIVFGSDLPSSRVHSIHRLPDSPDSYAERLYSTLRSLDGMGLDRILVEHPPDTTGWDAVRDRLQRGSTHVSTTRSAGGGSSGGSS